MIHKCQWVGVWNGGGVEAPVVHENWRVSSVLETSAMGLFHFDRAGMITPDSRWFSMSSRSISSDRCPARLGYWRIRRVPFSRSTVWRVSLIVPRRSLYQFLCLYNISLLSFFKSLSFTEERSTIDFQSCSNAVLFSRLQTWGSCYCGAGPSSFMTSCKWSGFWLVGVELLI